MFIHQVHRIGLTFTLLLVVCNVTWCADNLSPRQAWTSSSVKGSRESPAPYRIEPAFPKLKFQKPTSILELPGDRMLVTEIGGKIFTFAKNAGAKKAELLVDLVALLPEQDRGKGVALWSATLHPKFAENRYLFVCYRCFVDGEHNRVVRLKMTDETPPRTVRGSGKVIITYPSGPHSAGCVHFGAHGKLFISTGDGSGPNPPDGLTTGQDVSDLLGSILRIDVDAATGDDAYSVPADNPFVDTKGARGEIWAYGLRNPWKFGIDRQTGDIFVADNGWETWEMVHRIVRGGNCGWPVMEGRAALRTEVQVGPTPIRPPVKDHPHTEANSVIGGPVYRGRKLPALNGSFVYGDYITGTIWAIKPAADDGYSHTTLVDTDLRIVGFAEGSGGELYVLDFDFTGQIYALRPSNVKDDSADFPRRLSETGLFASLQNLRPAPGVVPYDVNVKRWMDGATARRFIAIPGDGSVALASGPDKPSVFPDGTVFVKHVEWPHSDDQPPIRLETQLLHYEAGSWRPYSYLWDDAGKDAMLVDAAGADRLLRPAQSTESTWHVGATNECRLCHNAGSGYVLGFAPNQLDLTNQLVALSRQRVIATAPKIRANSPWKLVDPHDTSQPLDARARSYLHGNCGMCHHPRGNAIVSFYLRRDMPFDQLNTNKGTIIGTFGMGNAKVIVPGDPYRSVLMYRMSKLGYGRMPYIGSQAVDGRGIALIEQWIRSMPSDGAEASPPISDATPEAKALKLLDQPQGNRPFRDSLIRTMIKSTEGSLAILARMHAGALKPADFKAAVTFGSQSANSDIRGLFEHFVPEVQRRKRLGPNIQPESILSLTGDTARGKLIYFSDAGRCRACHDFNDAENSLGPTLAEINKKYQRPAELLQHVLEPSRKIEDKFATYTVITTNGRIITGLLVEKNAQDVRLKTAEKKLVTIRLAEVDEFQKSPKSLMPKQILSDLTPQEAADLMVFVQSVSQKTK